MSAERAVRESENVAIKQQRYRIFHALRSLMRELLERKAAGEVSPKYEQQLEVGSTPIGIQVWCLRHDVNVIHVDFEGHKHPANLYP